MALTNMQALEKARLIWGDAAFVMFQGNKIYQVGCITSDTHKTIVVASSRRSYDDAFRKVDMRINGPHQWEAIARDAAGNEKVTETRIFYWCNKSSDDDLTEDERSQDHGQRRR